MEEGSLKCHCARKQARPEGLPEISFASLIGSRRGARTSFGRLEFLNYLTCHQRTSPLARHYGAVGADTTFGLFGVAIVVSGEKIMSNQAAGSFLRFRDVRKRGGRHERGFFARNWWAVAIRGLLGMAVGVIALVLPGATMLALVLLFAAYMLGSMACLPSWRRWCARRVVRATAGACSRWEGVADIVATASLRSCGRPLPCSPSCCWSRLGPLCPAVSC